MKFLSALLALFTGFAGFMGLFVRIPKEETPAGDFVPVLRFTAASDVHIVAMGDKRCGRMAKLLKTGRAIARADEHYKALDGALFAGDITDTGLKTQFLAFESILKDNLEEETQPMVVVAKSHDCGTYKKEALSFYETLSGRTTDFHYTLNGFHFIGISTTHDENAETTYTTDQLAWLDA